MTDKSWKVTRNVLIFTVWFFVAVIIPFSWRPYLISFTVGSLVVGVVTRVFIDL